MIGIAAMKLGAGRAAKDDIIDHKAGIMLYKKPGDRICRGDVIAKLLTDKKDAIPDAARTVLDSLEYSDSQIPCGKMIYNVIK